MFFFAKSLYSAALFTRRKDTKNRVRSKHGVFGHLFWHFWGGQRAPCNSTERPQAACDYSLVVLKIKHPRQRVIPRRFNFCQNNDNIEMWHFLCYCLHSYLKCTGFLELKTVDTQGFFLSKRLLKFMLGKSHPFSTTFL